MRLNKDMDHSRIHGHPENDPRGNTMRQMVMVGFLQAQNCTNLVSSWRHPESREDSTSADYYQTIGRVLEEGKFHVGFFDDPLAMPTVTAMIIVTPWNTAFAA